MALTWNPSAYKIAVWLRDSRDAIKVVEVMSKCLLYVHAKELSAQSSV